MFSINSSPTSFLHTKTLLNSSVERWIWSWLSTLWEVPCSLGLRVYGLPTPTVLDTRFSGLRSVGCPALDFKSRTEGNKKASGKGQANPLQNPNPPPHPPAQKIF